MSSSAGSSVKRNASAPLNESHKRMHYFPTLFGMQGMMTELHETKGELDLAWKLTDFFSLPEQEDELYFSPDFYFADAIWCLQVYPNGESKCETIGDIVVYLHRRSSGTPINLTFSFGFKVADCKNLGPRKTSKNAVVDEENSTVGPGVLKRTELMKEFKLTPFDAVIITCDLCHAKSPISLGGSLFTRLLNLGQHLFNILISQQQADVILKIEEDKLLAHRMILESRSLVFSAMFNHDMTEKKTGEVIIKDISLEVMKSILSYMYSGQITYMSYDNVFDIYAAADRYNFSDLKTLCRTFIEKNLCAERICDVIQFADFYNEQETKRIAKAFLKNNREKVLKTDEWKAISNQNPEFWMNVLISAVGENCIDSS